MVYLFLLIKWTDSKLVDVGACDDDIIFEFIYFFTTRDSLIGVVCLYIFLE